MDYSKLLKVADTFMKLASGHKSKAEWQHWWVTDPSGFMASKEFGTPHTMVGSDPSHAKPIIQEYLGKSIKIVLLIEGKLYVHICTDKDKNFEIEITQLLEWLLTWKHGIVVTTGPSFYGAKCPNQREKPQEKKPFLNA